MTTTPTQLPVPSEKPQDLKFNAGKIDEFVTSMGWTYTDRLNVKHYTIEGLKHIAEQAISAFGYITIDSFEGGATLTLPNQVLRWQNNGEYYRWDGIFPKVVAPGSTPNTAGGIGVGAWVGVSDASLRANLISNEDGMGGSLVRLTGGETVQGFVYSIELYASDFGFTGVGDETAKWKLFCQEMRSKVLDVSIGISGEGILADNTSLRAIHGCGITLTGNVTGTTVSGSEAHCLVAGNNSTIDSVVFNGGAEYSTMALESLFQRAKWGLKLFTVSLQIHQAYLLNFINVLIAKHRIITLKEYDMELCVGLPAILKFLVTR